MFSNYVKSIAITLCFFCATFSYADLNTDLNSDLSIENVVNNALAEGLTASQILTSVNTAKPDVLAVSLSSLISIDKPSAPGLTVSAATLNTDKLVELATAALQTVPEQAVDIIQALQAAGFDVALLTEAILLAGLDPTAILEATAAGLASVTAPGEVNFPITPTTTAFGNVSGGGGGGIASAD